MSRTRPEITYPDGFIDDALPKGTFSHSQYGMYKRCPKQYEFRYVLGLMRPPEVAMIQGIAVHGGVENTLQRKIDGDTTELDEALAYVSDVYDDFEDEVEDAEELNAGKDVAIRAYSQYHQEGLPTVNPIAVEKGFAIKFGDAPMIGFADIIDDVDGFHTVSDVKVSKRSWSQTMVDTNTQLTLYSKAFGTPDVRIDQLVKNKSGIKFAQKTSTRGLGDYAVLEDDVSEVVSLVKGGTFPKTEIGHWCCSPKFCGFWDMCRGKLAK